MIAFGLNDLAIVAAVLENHLYSTYGLFSKEFTFFVYGVGSVALQVGGLAVLTFAMLRWSLLGIEVKLKRSLLGGALAAPFVLAFLVVSQLVENTSSQSLGVVGGAIAAALLLFVLGPIQRTMTGFVNRAMPNVGLSPEYLSFQRLEFYRAALESAVEVDRRISRHERTTLDLLVGKLGIGRADARALETDVLRRFGVSALHG